MTPYVPLATKKLSEGEGRNLHDIILYQSSPRMLLSFATCNTPRIKQTAETDRNSQRSNLAPLLPV